MAASPGEYRFSGFAFPTTTPVPDQLFDELLAILSGAELKVLLYIIRRTFGFKKESDDISISQMLNGIVKQDGTVLDYGVGLSKPTLLAALRSLKEKNILLSERRSSEDRGNEPSRYRLNILTPLYAVPTTQSPQREAEKETQPPLVKKVDQGVVKKFDQGLVKKSTPQQTVVQQTDLQQQTRSRSNNNSGGRPTAEAPSPPGVVVALTDRGITPSVAQRLAKRHSEQRILEKIEYLEFLLDAAPDKVTNPKGWLRRAIEDDYAAPDGFQSKAERQRVAQAQREQEERLAQSRREHEKAQEKKRQEEAERKRRVVAAIEQRYGTTAEQRQLWQQVQKELDYYVSDGVKPMVAEARLLTVAADGTAVVGTFDQVAQQILGARLAGRIAKELSSKGQPVSQVDVVLIREESNHHPTQ